MKLFKNQQNIINKYPLIGHGALMLLIAGSAFFVQHACWGPRPPLLNAPMTMMWALLAIIPLLGRWLFLIIALIFVTIIMVAANVFNFTGGANLSSIASMIVIFSATAYGGRRRNLSCAMSIVTFNGGLIYNLMFGGNVGFLSSSTLFNVIGLFWNLVTFLAIWRFGNKLRFSREQTLQLRERTEILVRKRRDKFSRVVSDKFVHIARELHYVSARLITTVSIYTGTAQQVLKRYSQKVMNVLSLIETSNRQTVAELYRLIGLLRNENLFEKFTPQTSVQQLEKLVSDMPTAGLQVNVQKEGEKREIPQTVELSA